MDENWNPSDGKVNGLMAQGFLSETFFPDILTIKTEPLTDTYTMEARPFARGKFATVRRCRHKASGQDFAAKIIRKRRRAADVRHEILHEVCVLKLTANCKNNRIVRLHDVFETPTEVILVLELISGGELQRVIDDEEAIPETDVVRLMKQILEGLAILHHRNIAHLDIKPQNILLTNSFPQCDVKLCDFGISRVITKGIEIREIVGTPDYVAPEVLQYEPISLATDMWSIGILAYVLLSGHTPFGGDSKQETFCNITDGHLEFPKDIFDGVSNDAKDFIRRLLVREPSDRMVINDCLKHSWLCKSSSDFNALNVSQESSVPLILSKADDNATTALPNSNHSTLHGTGDIVPKLDNESKHDPHVIENVENVLGRVENPSAKRINENIENSFEEPKVQSTELLEESLQTKCGEKEMTPDSEDSDLTNKENSQIKEPVNLEENVSKSNVLVVPIEAVVEETGRDVTIPLSQLENRLEDPALRNHIDEDSTNKRVIHILPDLKLRRERSTTPTPNKEVHSRHTHHNTVHHVTCTSSSSSIERQSMKTKSEMVEFDGLTLSKRLIFSEEILVDERMGMVY